MENIKKSIAILLATYNGAKFLSEQIDSILKQTCKDWTLYIHDDNSNDNTLNIIKNYVSKYRNIRLLQYSSKNGAKENFFSLLDNVEADYYFFCDQDDVWCKDKIQQSLERMEKLEAENADIPILIHSDLYITDSKLNIINNSFLKYSGIEPELLNTFNKSAASNIVTGCTMLINKKAKECIKLPTKKVTMHDTWITLCVLKAKGKVSLINKPLVFYRQHGNNTVGVNNLNKSLLHKIQHITNAYNLNHKNYIMLKDLGYGSIIKYITYKLRYKIVKTFKTLKR